MALRQRLHRLLLDTDSTSTTASGYMNRSREPFTTPGDSNFDTNMVFILAALLCALIFALGLNSIVRCILRCSNRFAFETPDEAMARLASKGLKKSALRKIPVAVYGSGGSSTSLQPQIVQFVLGSLWMERKLEFYQNVTMDSM